jgi:hypothetical protein
VTLAVAGAAANSSNAPPVSQPRGERRIAEIKVWSINGIVKHYKTAAVLERLELVKIPDSELTINVLKGTLIAYL